MQPTDFVRGPVSGAIEWSIALLVGALMVSLAAILIYIPSLIFLNTPPLIFDLAHLVSVVALSAILVKSSRLKFSEQLLLVMFWLWVMRMMIPLRFPEGIISNYPDMIYELQIIQKIAATGTISFNAPTSYAGGYIFTPMLETFITISGNLLGLPFDTVLKYSGPVFGIPTIAFLFGFNKAFLPKKEALIAAFLGVSCFWVVRTDAFTVHESLALVFLTLTLYSLTQQGPAWRFVTLLSAFATVSTHEFTSIVGSVFFLFACIGILWLVRVGRLKRGATENTMLKMPGLMVTMTFTWLAFVALPFFATFLGFADYVASTLLGATAPIAFPLTVAKGVPTTWDRLAGDLGVLLFAAASLGGFLILMRRSASPFKQFLPYGASGALLFFIGLAFYFRNTQGSDLLSRGFIYVYFFAAPLALYVVFQISSSIRGSKRRQLVAVALISIMIVSGVYYNYPRYFHDNTVPKDPEDVRSPLYQWQSAGYFALDHLGENVVWGDKIAFSYVGGYGEKNVHLMDQTLDLTLVEFMSAYPSSGDIVVLRQTMTIAPYANYVVTQRDLHAILAGHNVVYASGEVVMVMMS